MSDRINPKQRRGRGAVTNDLGRFERHTREVFDDGWDRQDDTQPIRTELIRDNSKSIIAKNSSPDIFFDRSINAYRGCEHGCIYCYARPTHTYLGYGAGLDFETKIHFKPDAVKLLAMTLAKPSYRPKPIAMGTNTDPYQPVEKEKRITLGILEYLWERRHPVTITTKGALILRDVDILAKLADENLLHVLISITTLDNKLHAKMEPRAAAPTKRLQIIKALSEAGISVGVLAAPMIPKLNDTELEAILTAAHKVGARSGNYIPLRMPLEVADLFREWLQEHYPDRANKVIKHIQETQGGRDYNAGFGSRFQGQGAYAQLLNARFAAISARLGFGDRHPPLRTDLFRPPPRDARQMELF